MVRNVSWLVCLAILFAGCTSNGKITRFGKAVEKVVKVSTKTCEEVREYEGLVRLGTEIALSQASTLKAKLIVHGVIDDLIRVCDAHDMLVGGQDE